MEAGAAAAIGRTLAGHGAAYAAVEADLSDPGSPALVFDEAERPRRVPPLPRSAW